MGEYVQVGIAAMRDPVTGEALEAVPLYANRADKSKLPDVDMKSFATEMAGKMKAYLNGVKKSKAGK